MMQFWHITCNMSIGASGKCTNGFVLYVIFSIGSSVGLKQINKQKLNKIETLGNEFCNLLAFKAAFQNFTSVFFLPFSFSDEDIYSDFQFTPCTIKSFQKGCTLKGNI